MVTTNFGIKGAKEMEQLLKQLGPQIASRVADQALRAAAKLVVADAKRRVPVATGALKESLTVNIERRRKDENQRLVLIGFKRPTSRVAHLVEFGTRHSPAQPFLRPALDSQASGALNEMGKVLARGVEREAKKLAKP